MRASYLLLLPALLAPAAAAAQDDATAREREIFRNAWEQAAALRPDAADTAALRGYVLYPYLQAARLRWALSRVRAGTRDSALDARVHEFLTLHKDTPVTRELERDWLRYLGERAAWVEFRRDAPAALADPVLQCYAFSARLEGDDRAGLREAVLEFWLSQRDVPAACKAAVRWLDTPERLSDAEIEQRARVAAQAGVALPAALAALPRERQAVIHFERRLLAQPKRGLERFLAGDNLVAPDKLPAPPPAEIAGALLEAFDRSARRNSKDTREIFAPLQRHAAFTDAQRAQLQRSYALGLAYDHDVEALRQFELPAEALDALGHEWRVRSALLHGYWKLALRWIEAMPPLQQQEPRWNYWRARALEQREEPQAAAAFYETAAREREYYGFLAAERLGRKPDLRPQALPDDPRQLEALAALPALQRARELYACGLTELAAGEFRFALREASVPAQAQAARLAASWGWHDRAILLASELQLWDDLWLRFPLPYDGPIEAAAKETGVSADWLYTVVRTESLYNPRAVSRASALGLMQLLLPTARQVARAAKLNRPAREDLFEPQLNVALGARYLRRLHERFDGRFIFMLAAYNAGPQRLPQWLPKAAVPGDVWVENVPYNETRTYIQRALSSLVMFGWRRHGEPTPILPHLSPVAAPVEDGA